MTSSRVHGSLDTWRFEMRATGALAFPIVLTNIMQMVVLLTNTAIVGHLGTQALAAIAIGSSVYFAVQPLTFGLAFAAGPILAQARGLGRRRDSSRRGWISQMRQSAVQAFVALAMVTVPSWLLLWHTRPLLLLIGESPTIAELASDYIRTLMWGLPLLGVFVILRGFLAATGRPRLALVAAAGQIPLNAALCWILVNGMHGLQGLGIAGAGLASTLVNLSMVLALLGLIERDGRLRRLGLFRASWRTDWPRLLETFRIGLPIAGHMWVEIGLFAAATLLVGRMGVLPVAAHAIAVQVAMLAYRVPMGISEASTARVGLAAGARHSAAAIRAGWGAIMLASGVLAAMSLVIVLAATILPLVFLDRHDPATPAVATSAAGLLALVAAFQLANGVAIVTAGALRGLRDTRVPAVLAGVSYWGVGLPAGLTLGFPLHLGVAGVWIGLAFGMTTAALLLLARFRHSAHALTA